MKIISGIFKGIINFFNLLLNYKAKYSQKDIKYKEKSLAKKIFLIIEMVAIPLIVLAFGLFFIPKCRSNALAYIVAVIGFIILGIGTVEFLIMNSVLGFRNMFFSAFEEHIIDPLKNKIKENVEITEDGIEIKTNETQTEDLGHTVKTDATNQKRHNKIDLTIGILGIVMTVVFIGLAILVGSKTIV